MAGGGVSTTVTVTYNENSTDFQYNNETLYIKIPAHTEYTLSFGDIENEFAVTPSSQTFTSEAYYSRTLNYTYEYSDLGVWIVDINGKLQLPSTWTQGSNATGVAVITDTVRLIVAPDEWHTYKGSDDGAWNGNEKSAWGGRLKTVTGIVTTTEFVSAREDFAGSFNTDAIISQLKGTTDDSSKYYTGAPAAEYCRAYSKGCKGVGEWYLPAVGEMDVITINKGAINTALTKISGETFTAYGSTDGIRHTWTSTQYDDNNAWYFYWWNGSFIYDGKDGDGGVRPVCQY